MKVSVALCTYNGERYLEPQLESLALQTEKPAEIVICDDRSTDATVEVASRFIEDHPDLSTVLTINEENLHFSGNFFKAASLCRSDWVAFCDQDDVWHSEKLAVIHAYLDRGENDLYIHPAAVWDMASSEAPSRQVPLMDTGLYPQKLEACIGSYTLGCCFTVRKSLLDLFPPFWTWNEYHMHREQHGAFVGHDMMIFAACWARRSIMLIPETLITYRLHGGNLFGQASTTSNRFQNLLVKRSSTSDGLARLGRKLLSEHVILNNISLEMRGSAARGIRLLSEASRRRGSALLARSEVQNIDISRSRRMKAFLGGVGSGAYFLGPRFYGITPGAWARDFASIIGIIR